MIKGGWLKCNPVALVEKPYRVALGLPAAIAADEDTPLLMVANSKRKRASNSIVLKAIIDIMGRAAGLAHSREQSALA